MVVLATLGKTTVTLSPLYMVWLIMVMVLTIIAVLVFAQAIENRGWQLIAICAVIFINSLLLVLILPNLTKVNLILGG
jgi:NADH:ubiquinone oxidoreductase subunit 3 (subunit A)